MFCFANSTAKFFIFVLFFQKHKKKKKVEVFNFSAIHLIHDPQGQTVLSH